MPALRPQVLQVAAGGMHGAAVTAGGGVWTWGVNDEGALGRQTRGEAWDKGRDAEGQPLRVRPEHVEFNP